MFVILGEFLKAYSFILVLIFNFRFLHLLNDIGPHIGLYDFLQATC